jgi:hypothetical protein
LKRPGSVLLPLATGQPARGVHDAGIGVHDALESVFTMPESTFTMRWNRCSRCAGARRRTADDLVDDLERAIALIHDDAARCSLIPFLYTPDSRIAGLIGSLGEIARNKDVTSEERRQAGELMEQVAFLALGGLRGSDVVKSFRSSGPQIDLLVNGSTAAWRLLCSTIRIDVDKRGILVEAKARKTKVDDQDFARMCALLESTSTTCSVGVFFTLHGATGFSAKERAGLKHARLRQVLYFARCKTPVVVLNLEDLRMLDQPGSLVRLLEQRVREIEELAITPSIPAVSVEFELPPHLAALKPLRRPR